MHAGVPGTVSSLKQLAVQTGCRAESTKLRSGDTSLRSHTPGQPGPGSAAARPLSRRGEPAGGRPARARRRPRRGQRCCGDRSGERSGDPSGERSPASPPRSERLWQRPACAALPGARGARGPRAGGDGAVGERSPRGAGQRGWDLLRVIPHGGRRAALGASPLPQRGGRRRGSRHPPLPPFKTRAGGASAGERPLRSSGPTPAARTGRRWMRGRREAGGSRAGPRAAARSAAR